MLKLLVLVVAVLSGGAMAQHGPPAPPGAPGVRISEPMVLRASHFRAERDVVQDAPINYNCPQGTVLTVQSEDVDSIKMRCSVPTFCGNPQAPTTAAGSQCTGQGNYITAIKGSPFQSTCVEFQPPNGAQNYQENCGTYQIRPRGMTAPPTAPPTAPSNKATTAPPPGVAAVPVPQSGNGPPKPSTGNGPAVAPVPVDSKIEVQHQNSTPNTDFPAVKGIQSTPTGWIVSYCKPTCQQTTTTTTTKQPTTVTQKKQQTCSSAADCLAKCGGGGGQTGGSGVNKRKRDTQVQGASCVNGVCSCQQGQGGNNGGNSGGGGGGGFCFSADSTVTTPSGPMRMDSLKIGSQVMVFNEATGQTTFESVDSFIHRRTDVTTTFVDITTSAGSRMSLTPGHMVPVVPCQGGATQLLSAERVQVGQCVMAVDTQGQAAPAPITSIQTTTKTGIYAPLTQSGNLLVDRTVASCYSNYEGFNAQHSFYRIFIALQQVLFGGAGSTVVDVPPILHLFNAVSH